MVIIDNKEVFINAALLFARAVSSRYKRYEMGRKALPKF